MQSLYHYIVRYILLILLPLVTAGCFAQQKQQSGVITEMYVFEDTGCIMFKVQIDGTDQNFLIQGLSVRDLKRYEDDIWHTWAPLTDFTVAVTSYNHTFPDNGLSDALRYDEVEISSSAGTDHKNMNHVAPSLSAMLPWGSCRFEGLRDRTMVWVGAPTQDYQLKGGKFQFTTSVGHDFTNPVHLNLGP